MFIGIQFVTDWGAQHCFVRLGDILRITAIQYGMFLYILRYVSVIQFQTVKTAWKPKWNLLQLQCFVPSSCILTPVFADRHHELNGGSMQRKRHTKSSKKCLLFKQSDWVKLYVSTYRVHWEKFEWDLAHLGIAYTALQMWQIRKLCCSGHFL